MDSRVGSSIDALAAREVAVLGGVGDGVAHARDALLVHQVDDQLELVQALEVGQSRVVAALDQRLVAGAHELRHPAAEHRLLAEQVGLRLVLEGGLDHAGARAADAASRRRAPGREPCRWRPVRWPSGRARRCRRRTGAGPDGPGPWAPPSPRRPRGRGRSDRSGSRSRGRTCSRLPGAIPSRISPSQTSACFSSGSRIITTSPSTGGVGDRRALSGRRRGALSTDEESSRRPTTTSTPESLRLSACAWPCEP